MQQQLSSTPRRRSAAGPAVFPYGRVEGTSRWPATPGAADCPHCGAVAIDAQGLLDCPDCEWRGRVDAP